jgi:hypothetical protein
VVLLGTSWGIFWEFFGNSMGTHWEQKNPTPLLNQKKKIGPFLMQHALSLVT